MFRLVSLIYSWSEAGYIEERDRGGWQGRGMGEIGKEKMGRRGKEREKEEGREGRGERKTEK